MSGVFISWTKGNGRTTDLAERLGLQAQFIHRPSRLGLPGRYLDQLLATRSLLKHTRPERVVLMLPPAPALLSLIGRLPKRATGSAKPRGRFAADLHTGFFRDPKWQWACKLSLRTIRRVGGVAVITNEALRSQCEREGVRAIVLHDIILERDVLTSEGHLLCPLSYANDEPVREILEAARLTPEIRWVFTGRAPQRVRDQAPGNIHFTGFITDEAYDRLLLASAGVVALTTRPHTMQRAGYEAFGAGVPQLTADFPELREFYAASAIYTDADSKRIAAGARALIEQRDELQRRTLELRPLRVVEQQAGLAELREALGLT